MNNKNVDQEKIVQEQASNSFSLLLFIILGVIGTLTPLAIDMYLPAMPDIARDLGIAEGDVQATLFIYTAGFAGGQLIHGPLTDSFGRRPVLIIGVICFAIASLFITQVDSMEQLITARAFQGFAGAGSAVVVQAIVRDMFAREDFSRAISFITLVTILAPLVAPMIGGHLTVWFNWRVIFLVLAIVAILVIFAILWKIPETLAVEKRQKLDLLRAIKNYLNIFASKQSVGLMLANGFSFAGMFSFLTAGSFVYIELYGLTPEEFGYLFSLNIISMIIFTSLNGRLVKKLGSHFMLRLGLTIQLIASILLVCSWIFNIGLWLTVFGVMLFVGTLAVIGSNTVALLLNNYQNIAGTAASLAGTVRFGLGSIVSGIVALLPDSTDWPMLVVMFICAVLSALFYAMFASKA